MKAIIHASEPLKNPAWEAVGKDRVLSGSPRCAHAVLHVSASEEFYTGIYECTPGKWTVSYSEDEFCTLIEGRLRLTSDTGETQEFTAPDSFTIPSGYAGTWEALTPLRKFFAIYEKKK